ncbi:hypothetical protein BTW07_10915 [Salinicola socius]|uniref:Uncharacterized protein n=1 Tax=Salinicola socius TaxID=404433 RepID=A0A1Q8SRT3_9GAMM|nr:hypothetical protein BTW07_10915 [Salinicola socius]
MVGLSMNRVGSLETGHGLKKALGRRRTCEGMLGGAYRCVNRSGAEAHRTAATQTRSRCGHDALKGCRMLVESL